MSLSSALLDGRAQNGGVPEPDPAARPQRRRFTAEYKQAILAEYEAAPDGEKGSVLRREGLYSSQITEWRQARDAGVLGALQTRTRGSKRSATDVELEKLKRKHQRTELELTRTKMALDIMGKASALLESLAESAESDKRSTK
jgi:transposase-like protein